MALGQMIGQIPDQFMKGRENARTIAKEDAFKNGMPVLKDADGNPVKDQNGNPVPDVNAIVNTGFKLGGCDYAAGMMPYIQGQGVSARQGQIDSEVQGFGGAPAANPRPNNGATGPGHLTLPPPRQVPQAQPQLSSAGADNQGQQTINSLASEVFGERDVTELLPKYAAAVRNKLGDPLTPQQEQAARTMMQRTAASMNQQTPPQRPEDYQAGPGPGSAVDRASNGPSGAGGVAQNGPGGANAAPLPASGVSGGPGPQQGSAPNRTASAPVEAVLSALPENEAVLLRFCRRV